jgi:hypothetical protein
LAAGERLVDLTRLCRKLRQFLSHSVNHHFWIWQLRQFLSLQ